MHERKLHMQTERFVSYKYCDDAVVTFLVEQLKNTLNFIEHCNQSLVKLGIQKYPTITGYILVGTINHIMGMNDLLCRN